MIITVVGRIVECLPQQSGVGKNGNEWKAQQFIVSVNDDPEDIICFQVFGAERIASYDLKVGKRVAVTLDICTREYNGKWMTNISCKHCWVAPKWIEKEKEITSNEFEYD